MNNANAPLGGKKIWFLIASIVVAMGAYLMLSLWAGRAEAVRACERIGAGGLAAALLLSLCNYGFRFARWQIYLHCMERWIPWKKSLMIYLAGFALTTTPGKAGEMVRSFFLKNRGVPYTDSLAAFISERLSDLLAMFLIALPGVAIYYGKFTALFALLAAGLLIFILILSQRRFSNAAIGWLDSKKGRISRTLKNVFNTLLSANRCYSAKCFLVTVALSLFAWFSESFAFFLILHWLGTDVSVPLAASIYAIAVLIGALSFLPGGLGGAEAALVALLLLKGVPNADAVVATVIIRLTTLWFAVVLGLGCFVRRGLWEKKC
jgi:uncharacterized protein (TIRG00374 family)